MLNPVLLNVTTGQQMRFAYQIASGQTLIVDAGFGRKTATLAAFGTEINLLPYAVGAFWELASGVNQILITADGPVPGGTASLSYNARYMEL